MLLNFGVNLKALNPCSETVVIDVERLTSRHFVMNETYSRLQNDWNISFTFYIVRHMVSIRIGNLREKLTAMPLNVYVDDVIQKFHRSIHATNQLFINQIW